MITHIRDWESTRASWASPGVSRILEEGGGQTQPATSKTHSPTGLELANYLGCTSASSWSGPAHGLPSGVAQKAQYRQTCCRPLERPRCVCACVCVCVCVVIPLSPPTPYCGPHTLPSDCCCTQHQGSWGSCRERGFVCDWSKLARGPSEPALPPPLATRQGRRCPAAWYHNSKMTASTCVLCLESEPSPGVLGERR